ncbi:MAG: rod shape-determining protein MreC [Negativicutes bacterium]|nr:rod shape-determining protein MreC [Negativicutes bacterium]
MQNQTPKKDRFTLWIIAGVILLCLMIAFDVRTSSISSTVQGVTRDVLAPMQKWSAEILDWWRESVDTLRSLQTLKEENAELKEQNDLLLQAYSRMLTVEAENQRLQQMLDFKQTNLQYEIEIAKIIGWPASNWSSRYILGLGSKDGISKNMVAVSTSGLIGKIVQVTEATAELMLLTDELSSVGVRIQSSGCLGIVSGNGAQTPTLTMSFISSDAVVKEGDLVVTSGLSDIYPEGLVIGKVVRCAEEASGMHQTAEVEMISDFYSLYEVMILRNVQSVPTVTANNNLASGVPQ